jgi:hypothetical protein
VRKGNRAIFFLDPHRLDADRFRSLLPIGAIELSQISTTLSAICSTLVEQKPGYACPPSSGDLAIEIKARLV